MRLRVDFCPVCHSCRSRLRIVQDDSLTKSRHHTWEFDCGAVVVQRFTGIKLHLREARRFEQECPKAHAVALRLRQEAG